MNKKNNARFMEMDGRIRDVFVRLLETVDFEKVTVKMICEKASVNRSTFYAHFHDLYELLEQVENSLNRELLEDYEQRGWENIDLFSCQSLIPFLEHIRRYRNFYQCAMKYHRSKPQIWNDPAILNNLIRPACEKSGIISTEEAGYYCDFFEAGFTMILRRWVDSSCVKPEAEIARLIHNCMPAGLLPVSSSGLRISGVTAAAN